MLKMKLNKNLPGKIQQSFYQKIIIGTLLFSGLIVVWFCIYYQPTRAEISGYARNISQWTQKIRMATVSEDAIGKLAQDVDTLNVQIKKIEERIYYLDDMPDIAKQIIRFASAHRLSVQSMLPNYDVLFPVGQMNKKGQPLVKVPLEIRLTGRYISLGKFITDTDKLPFVFSPDEVYLEADAKIYPRLRITVKGFLFLLNEEKARTSAGEKAPAVKKG